MIHSLPIDDSPEGLTLTARDPLLRLAREVLANELAALHKQLPAVGEVPGSEGIHQMRIAIRRIRVALRLFADFMPQQTEHLRDEFRWLGRALGQVRDLDVYRQGLAALSGSLPPAAAPLERSIAQRRAAVRAKLARKLATARFAELMAKSADLVHRELTPGTLRRWRSLQIGAAADADLRKSLARVLRLGRRIDADSTPRQLHRLRIRAKRLRYESEFYAPFRPSAQKLARAAKALQDALGKYRDACFAVERLRKDRSALLEPGEEACHAALEALLDAQAAQAVAARRDFSAAWRSFEKRAQKTKLAPDGR